MKIAAMSDLHGFQPHVPDADLVIIAGDVCPDSIRGVPAVDDPGLQGAWFDALMRPWIAGFNAPTLLTWGNHDFCGEHSRPGAPVMRKHYRNLKIVVDLLAIEQGLRIWMSPWSNAFMKWAWMLPPKQLESVYRKIPEGIDILVSHQPPNGSGDRYPNLQTGQYEHIGSVELVETILRVRPQLVICGHLHGGYGRYDLDGIPVYNVSVVNDAYQLVNPVTVIHVEPRPKEKGTDAILVVPDQGLL